MQTFLPYPNFKQTAHCLDSKRLGKQRVEALTIYNTLYHGGGWKNHPAVKMWKDYECYLATYYNVILEEWIARGYKNSMKPLSTIAHPLIPYWRFDERVYSSHRSNLLRKNPSWYSRFGWEESANLPYFWPSRNAI